MLTRRTLLSGASAAAVATSAGGVYLATTDESLSAPIPEGGGALALPDPSSSAMLTLAAPLKAIEDAVNARVPSQKRFKGRGKKICANLLVGKICTHPTYDATVSLDGAIAINGTGDAITVAIPLKVEGKGGISGDVARLLSLSGKRFRARFIAEFTMRLILDADWRITPIVRRHLRWVENPRVEIVHRINVDIKGEVEPRLRDELETLARDIEAAVDRDMLRREAEQIWRPHSLDLSALEGAPPLYMHIAPTGAATSGLVITDDAAQLMVRLDAKTVLDGRPETALGAGPLPPLAFEPVTPSRLKISTVLRAEYALLNAQLAKAFVGRRFEEETALGPVAVEFETARLYPTDTGFAVAGTFRAETPSSWFDTAGDVTFAATPAVSDDGRVLLLRDVAIRRRLDSTLWSAVTALFDEQITDALEAALRHDFGPQISAAQGQLTAALAGIESEHGLRVTVRDSDARLGAVAAEASVLAARVDLDMAVDLTVTKPIALVPPA